MASSPQDSIGLQRHVQLERKRGRPRIESNSNLISLDDGIAIRKERVRLAQRAYRNRRDTKVDGLKARVARLEHALEQTTNSFTRFQNLVIGEDNLPPKIVLEISRTALDIASAVREAHSEGPFQELLASDSGGMLMDRNSTATNTRVSKEPVGEEVLPNATSQVSSIGTTSAPSNDSTILSRPNPRSIIDSSLRTATQQQNLAARPQEIERRTWFTALLLQLCSEQGVQLLTSPDTTVDDLHPALSIHLTWVTVDQLRAQCLRARTTNFENIHEDPEQSVIFGSIGMYRSIEGSDGFLVPRSGKLEPQQLVHGRTRTRLRTNLQDFQGEWLEPIDVQEFLEEKGFFLGSGGQGGVLQFAIPEGNLRDIWTHDANAIFTEEIQRSRIVPSLPIAIDYLDNELLVSGEAMTEVEKHQAPAFVRMDPSLSTWNQEQFVVSGSLHEPHAKSSAARHSLRNELCSPVTPESLIEVTLHLDRLMRFLVTAASCIGSGPGIRKEAIERALRLSIAKH
ncbi:hypothetical protein DL95DRAFT_448154 [Leptodontidium sp. 2 PMI_412]|nr:hypothetical protein DL95DRAFT_448154 [Leptodontidium sp. 2 PMI_412]